MSVQDLHDELLDLLRFFAADHDVQRRYLPRNMPTSLCQFDGVRFATDKPRLILAERCKQLCASNVFSREPAVIGEIRSALEIMTESDAHYFFLFGEPSSEVAEANESIMRLWDVLRRLSLIALDEGIAAGIPKRPFDEFYSALARPMPSSQTSLRIR